MITRLLCVLSLFVSQAIAAKDIWNPPWFPSVSAFEHYDSGRSHVFSKAKFGGSFSGNNQVSILASTTLYPSGYNMCYLDPENVYIYGGVMGMKQGPSEHLFQKSIRIHSIKSGSTN